MKVGEEDVSEPRQDRMHEASYGSYGNDNHQSQKKKKSPHVFMSIYNLNIRAICLGRGALAKALQLEKEAPLSTALPFGALPE